MVLKFSMVCVSRTEWSGIGSFISWLKCLFSSIRPLACQLSINTRAAVRARGVLCKLLSLQIAPRRGEARRSGETRSQSPLRGADAGEKASERAHRRRAHVGGRPWRCSASCWTCATSRLPSSTASSRYEHPASAHPLPLSAQASIEAAELQTRPN